MSVNISQTGAETLDYQINWATRGLGTDTIASSSWAQSSDDITISDTSNTNTTTTFWLTGGVPGQFYEITNSIVTAGGRDMQETIIYECLYQRLA